MTTNGSATVSTSELTGTDQNQIPRPKETTDHRPDLASSIADLGDWLTHLAPAINRMSQIQQLALHRACLDLRRDLHTINLGVPKDTKPTR